MYPDNLFESVAQNIVAKLHKKPSHATIQKEANYSLTKLAFDPHLQAHFTHIQMAQQTHDDAVRMHQQMVHQQMFGSPLQISHSQAARQKAASLGMIGLGGTLGLGAAGLGGYLVYNHYKNKGNKNID